MYTVYYIIIYSLSVNLVIVILSMLKIGLLAAIGLNKDYESYITQN